MHHQLIGRRPKRSDTAADARRCGIAPGLTTDEMSAIDHLFDDPIIEGVAKRFHMGKFCGGLHR